MLSPAVLLVCAQATAKAAKDAAAGGGGGGYNRYHHRAPATPATTSAATIRGHLSLAHCAQESDRRHMESAYSACMELVFGSATLLQELHARQERLTKDGTQVGSCTAALLLLLLLVVVAAVMAAVMVAVMAVVATGRCHTCPPCLRVRVHLCSTLCVC